MTPKTSKQTSRVAIQGGYGAFHEIAAKHYFENENIEIVTANTFKDLFKSLKNNHADLGIMAIENSLAGSILPNYNLLQDSNMKIIGEIYLRIKQNLVALPGVKIEDITEVYSHPIAILQCQMFFDNYPNIKVLDSIDTALSAKDIADKKLKNTGAICSKLAADKYGLNILAEGIETNKMNYTRFLILSEKIGYHKQDKHIDKASITFVLEHQTGSLSKVLSILSYYGINLTKIQSMPIIGKDWEYQFYVDVTFNDYVMYRQALDAIRPFTSRLDIMGEYAKGKTVME
ncbi:MAG TPA: prephenate dehydratase [Bacteroidales bacterium]|nr:prephenate dehydratase [Bacteroidales bacterium]